MDDAAGDFLADAALPRQQHLRVTAGRVFELRANARRGADTNELILGVVHSGLSRTCAMRLTNGFWRADYRRTPAVNAPKVGPSCDQGRRTVS